MRLEISARAQRDIDGIFVYGLETFGETQARLYSKELLDLLDLLLVTPKLGIQHKIFGRPLRTLLFHNHLIFYRLGREKVRVVRILHGRQNWPDAI